MNFKLPKNTVLGLLSAVVIVLLILSGEAEVDFGEVIGTQDVELSEGLVTKIVDGDTFYAIVDGKEQSIRLIGVDTPETKHPNKAKQCFGSEATDYVSELLLNKVVTLENDTSDKDRYGRLLRYAWVGDTFVNYNLVLNGYAFSVAYPPDIKHQIDFEIAEQKAKEEELGVWSLACDY